MNFNLDEINYYYNKKEMLCLNCTKGRVDTRGWVYCANTKLHPDYQFFCSDFKLHKKSRVNSFNSFKVADQNKMSGRPRLSNIDPSYLDDFSKSTQSFFLFVMMIFVIPSFLTFLVSLISNEFSLVFYVAFVFAEFISVGIFYQFRTKIYRKILPTKFVGPYTNMPYYFAVLSMYAYHKKEKKTTNHLKIIEQTFIRVFGQNSMPILLDFFKNGIKDEISDPKFKQYSLQLDYHHRLLLFWLISEMCIFENIDFFKKSNFVKELTEILGIKEDDYSNVKEELELIEMTYYKKIE
jgi:hypothetical protein